MTTIRTTLTGAWIFFFATACSDPAENSATGSGGTANPGAGGSSGGNSSVGGSSAGGSDTGGTDPGAGGSVTGGSGAGGSGAGGLGAGGSAAGGAGAGGSGTGGIGPAGGASGTGGSLGACDQGPAADPVRPQLVVSGPNNFWQEATPATGSSANVTVTDTEHQTWRGFGGTFNEAGWDALSVLPQSEIDRAIALLFSPTAGANLAWGRIPIGASDYAMDRYSLNDNAGDYEMTMFSIDRDREMLIPYIHAALAVKPDIKFWGSPWSPPPWMKDNDAFNGGNMKSDEQTLQAHALYFARFVEEYEAECIDIDHVQPQNEPGYTTNYPSCAWAGGLMGTFVGQHLAPTFAERGIEADIWFGTLSNDEVYQSHIGGLTGAAADAVVGVGLQWNTMSHVGQLAGQGYLVMQTEHKCGNYRFQPETYNSTIAPNDHAYGVESWGLIRDWLNAGVHIYSAWNMVLDTRGENLDGWLQNAPLVVDRQAQQLILTPTYYVFRHLSQFVDVGAVRLGTQGGDALAFRNPDGDVAVVLYSGSGGSTSVAVGGTSYQFDVPSQGWATLYVEATP